MGTRYLIDSNILIKFQGNLMPENVQYYVSDIIDKDFNISVICEMDVLGHNAASIEVEEFINLANIVGIDKAVRITTIRLRKLYKIKLPDAIIAATSLVNDWTLLTQNDKDFRKIEGLKVENPFNI
jgi:toxin FitB